VNVHRCSLSDNPAAIGAAGLTLTLKLILLKRIIFTETRIDFCNFECVIKGLDYYKLENVDIIRVKISRRHMGFLDGMRRMMQGKPVFEAPVEPKERISGSDEDIRDVPSVEVTAPRNVVVPTFSIDHLKSHINDAGTAIEVYAWVTNTSVSEIEIERCVILNTKMMIKRRLGPGQSHEVCLYRGPIASNDYIHKANIFYEDISANEYYRADFSVEYNREANGLYTVEELHPEHYGPKELS
jgi:hypothetical protein